MQILGKMGQKRKTPFKQIIFSKWHHKHILIHCTLRTPKWATKQVWGGKMVKPLVSLADGVFSNIRFNHFNSPLFEFFAKIPSILYDHCTFTSPASICISHRGDISRRRETAAVTAVTVSSTSLLVEKRPIPNRSDVWAAASSTPIARST